MAHEWMAPPEEASRTNPIELNENSVERGRTVYLENCSTCHGDKLEGLDAEVAGITAHTPNLKKRIKTHTDGDFFWKIENGRGEMPFLGDGLSDDEIWDVINYIRSESEKF